MWHLRKISLLNGQPPEVTLLKAHDLAVHQQADALLEQAQLQAEAILAAARQQAEKAVAEQRAECESQFWQEADALFSAWQQQRQQEQDRLVSLAESLLTQAMQQLLSDFTPRQRFSALLQQLLDQHPRQQQATLYCATTQFEQVENWLTAQSSLVWQLSSDDRLLPDRLRLETPQGELLIDWDTLCQQLTTTPA